MLPPKDRKELGELVERACDVLEMLRDVESTHARVIERMPDPARACGLAEVLAAARASDGGALAELAPLLGDVVSRPPLPRDAALGRGDRGPGAPAPATASQRAIDVRDALIAQRLHAQAACIELRRALATGLAAAEAGATIELGRRLAATLATRAIAERAIRPELAAALETERARWASLATVPAPIAPATRGTRPAVARAEPRAPTRLDRAVVLIVASGPFAMVRIASTFERAGATTILADSRATASSLVRFFRVDAVVCEVREQSDPLLGVASDLQPDHRPALIAILASGAAAGAVVEMKVAREVEREADRAFAFVPSTDAAIAAVASSVGGPW
jgi:hypothetical protein